MSTRNNNNQKEVSHNDEALLALCCHRFLSLFPNQSPAIQVRSNLLMAISVVFLYGERELRGKLISRTVWHHKKKKKKPGENTNNTVGLWSVTHFSVTPKHCVVEYEIW